MDARINTNPELRKSLLHCSEMIEAAFVLREFQARPTHADLLKEKQIVVSDGTCRQPVTELHVRSIVLVGHLRRRRKAQQGNSSRSNTQIEKFPSTQIHTPLL